MTYYAWDSVRVLKAEEGTGSLRQRFGQRWHEEDPRMGRKAWVTVFVAALLCAGGLTLRLVGCAREGKRAVDQNGHIDGGGSGDPEMELSAEAQHVLQMYEYYDKRGPDSWTLFVMEMVDQGPEAVEPLLELMRAGRLAEWLMCDIVMNMDLHARTHEFADLLLREDLPESFIRKAISRFGGMDYQLDYLKRVANDEGRPDEQRERARHVRQRLLSESQ